MVAGPYRDTKTYQTPNAAKSVLWESDSDR
jgi:hypothetical protein